ncbi:MAG TPA: histidine kinase N-terminal 7TM domain-containing protein [Anaerolineales bacterium]|nr:histidine kinase N-terminal 7TM domain-containing protein [Anaerolineales bacterium]
MISHTPFLISIHLFASLSMIATIINLMITKVAYDHRSQRGGWSFSGLMFAVSWWGFAAGIQYSSFDLDANIFWAKMLYLGIAQVPFWYTCFAWELSGNQHLITKKNMLLMSIVPVIIVLMAWTNDYHQFVWTDYQWIEKYQAWEYTKNWGLNIFIVGYIYAWLLYGGFLIARETLRDIHEFFWQGVMLLAGIIIPWVINLLYIINVTSIGLDPTPMTFTISGLLFMLGIFRFHLLNFIQIAHDEVIGVMNDGMIVIDERKKVLDFNPAAKRQLREITTIEKGLNIKEVFNFIPAITEAVEKPSEECSHIFSTKIQDRYYEITCTPIRAKSSFFDRGKLGRMILIRDITDSERAKEVLAERNIQLEDELSRNEELRNQLYEAVIRDPLTNLYNRRFFEELAGKQFAEAKRYDKEVCLMMFDIDSFKRFNDKFGHLVGDEVLRTFGKYLLGISRESDVVCRYGGEEFVAILMDAAPAYIHQRAEKLLVQIRNLQAEFGGEKYSVTVSIGIGSYPMDGENLDSVLGKADERMYKAKRNGGDQVWSYLNEQEQGSRAAGSEGL